MNTINMDNLQTVSDVARDLGVTTNVTRTMLGDLAPTLKLKVGRGYALFYDREVVKQRLRERHAGVLAYLGYTLSPEESYESVVQP